MNDECMNKTESADGVSVLLVERQLHERCYRWSRVQLQRTYSQYSTVSKHSTEHC